MSLTIKSNESTKFRIEQNDFDSTRYNGHDMNITWLTPM